MSYRYNPKNKDFELVLENSKARRFDGLKEFLFNVKVGLPFIGLVLLLIICLAAMGAQASECAEKHNGIMVRSMSGGYVCVQQAE